MKKKVNDKIFFKFNIIFLLPGSCCNCINISLEKPFMKASHAAFSRPFLVKSDDMASLRTSAAYSTVPLAVSILANAAYIHPLHISFPQMLLNFPHVQSVFHIYFEIHHQHASLQVQSHVTCYIIQAL